MSDEIVWELFLQVGPVGTLWVQRDELAHHTSPRTVNVYMPKDRVTNQHQGYGFVEFKTEDDADYVCVVGAVMYRYTLATTQALKVLNMIKLHGKPIRVNKASQDKQHMNIGANLFIGNLDPDVDEKVRSCHLFFDTDRHHIRTWCSSCMTRLARLAWW